MQQEHDTATRPTHFRIQGTAEDGGALVLRMEDLPPIRLTVESARILRAALDYAIVQVELRLSVEPQ